ncbi:hypothetical protein R1flu_013270 [Riccia fluitans]|uniref:Uncharacterized protein n=1 Tax=Riccia fluitans TaxID=41844 RepID=A0ABD1YGD3_9MARC
MIQALEREKCKVNARVALMERKDLYKLLEAKIEGFQIANHPKTIGGFENLNLTIMQKWVKIPTLNLEEFEKCPADYPDLTNNPNVQPFVKGLNADDFPMDKFFGLQDPTSSDDVQAGPDFEEDLRTNEPLRLQVESRNLMAEPQWLTKSTCARLEYEPTILSDVPPTDNPTLSVKLDLNVDARKVLSFLPQSQIVPVPAFVDLTQYMSSLENEGSEDQGWPRNRRRRIKQEANRRDGCRRRNSTSDVGRLAPFPIPHKGYRSGFGLWCPERGEEKSRAGHRLSRDMIDPSLLCSLRRMRLAGTIALDPPCQLFGRHFVPASKCSCERRFIRVLLCDPIERRRLTDAFLVRVWTHVARRRDTPGSLFFAHRLTRPTELLTRITILSRTYSVFTLHPYKRDTFSGWGQRGMSGNLRMRAGEAEASAEYVEGGDTLYALPRMRCHGGFRRGQERSSRIADPGHSSRVESREEIVSNWVKGLGIYTAPNASESLSARLGQGDQIRCSRDDFRKGGGEGKNVVAWLTARFAHYSVRFVIMFGVA